MKRLKSFFFCRWLLLVVNNNSFFSEQTTFLFIFCCQKWKQKVAERNKRKLAGKLVICNWKRFQRRKNWKFPQAKVVLKSLHINRFCEKRSRHKIQSANHIAFVLKGVVHKQQALVLIVKGVYSKCCVWKKLVYYFFWRN